jgi:hypothetical protein
MTSVKHINALIKELSEKELLKSSAVSDGYHTFEELYHHRNILFVKLCKFVHDGGKHPVWRSVKQSDGKMDKGWFIMGVGTLATTQITYHLPIDLWNDTMFAETLEKAPDYDQHTSKDVIDRISKLL